ncbi:BQ5605_C015g07841 [Microbotryum silenes-dioicae]|uniref:BQ5605_C015g07841 protein n=1 Tax=Microbotryum silenes-dioicae TaxID=796604 RepID=A0A2X0NQP7_9BASI|nr:BQ5605_C015g07841 [Microbotryum silenes-dioicae]
MTTIQPILALRVRRARIALKPLKPHVSIRDDLGPQTAVCTHCKARHWELGPPVFRVFGRLYHRLGALIPAVNQRPAFAQTWLIDPAVSIRQNRRAERWLADLVCSFFWRCLRSGRACFRRLESEDGPASQRVLFNCRKGMRMLDGTCVNCPTSSDGNACCTDPFATSCSEVDTSLTCRKGYGLPTERSRTCLQQYTVSRFGSEVIGHGKLGLGQSFETAYVIPSTTYTKCIAFSRIASERIAYYSTATKSCVLQRISTFDPTTLTHAPTGFSVSVLGGCQDASKRSPGKEALRLGARCIEQIFYTGQNGQRGKPSGY